MSKKEETLYVVKALYANGRVPRPFKKGDVVKENQLYPESISEYLKNGVIEKVTAKKADEIEASKKGDSDLKQQFLKLSGRVSVPASWNEARLKKEVAKLKQLADGGEAESKKKAEEAAEEATN